MDVRLPPLAEGADSGTVVNVLISEGDRIDQGQTILELENQKAIAPIPSTAAGKVKTIQVKAGDVINVGQVLITLEEEGAPPAKPQARPAQRPAEPPQPRPPVPSGEERPAPVPGIPTAAPPSLRKWAQQAGLDLSRVRGSGPGGRITWEDLQTHVQALQSAGQVPAPKPPAASIDFSRWGPVRRERFSPLRRSVAKAMEESWWTIPHVTQFHEADVTEILELVGKYSPVYEKKGVRLTLTALILRAVTQTLKKQPIFNASLDEAAGEIVYKEYVHLGIAVDTEAGLIVPVLRDVDKKDLTQIAKELAQLAERTRQRRVSMEELQGAGFTVSNQGGIGGSHFTPIIHKPEVAVLGVGRAVLKPVYLKEGKAPKPRWMLPLALSYDHRVIDGAQAARFVGDLAQALEKFPPGEVVK